MFLAKMNHNGRDTNQHDLRRLPLGLRNKAAKDFRTAFASPRSHLSRQLLGGPSSHRVV
jgi:hypothetical protein